MMRRGGKDKGKRKKEKKEKREKKFLTKVFIFSSHSSKEGLRKKRSQIHLYGS